jgi:hypothetical protein
LLSSGSLKGHKEGAVKELTMRQRRAVSRVTAREYQQASKKEKGRILTTFIKQTKLNRVYAGWLLRHWGKKVWVWIDGEPLRLVVGARRRGPVAPRPRTYGPSLIEALRKVWYLFDCMCGKRLAVVLRTSVELLIELGELKVSSAVRQKLSRISPATIDRLLAGEKRKLSLKGRSLTKPGTLLKHQIPIRTFSQWDDDRPGFLEIDMVGHEGGNPHGDFALTLDATDVATGWTEMRAVPNKARRWVLEALRLIRSRLPFPVRGIDSDNGSEFINDHLFSYCRDEQITFTRSRPYRKNDTCYIEQKNWTVVRKSVGYRRYDTPRELLLLNTLYDNQRLLVNFFHPSMKLISKGRHGAKVRKHHDTPKTPYQRVLDHPKVDQAVKCRLRSQMHSLNPVQLKRNIAQVQQRLEAIALAKAKVKQFLKPPAPKPSHGAKRR